MFKVKKINYTSIRDLFYWLALTCYLIYCNWKILQCVMVGEDTFNTKTLFLDNNTGDVLINKQCKLYANHFSCDGGHMFMGIDYVGALSLFTGY